MREPLWLETDDVIAINQDIVAQTSEPHFLREPNLLESALARPINLFLYGEEADLVVLAARLMEGIVRNHAFEQGNKRTAFLAGLTFLEMNGVDTRRLPDNGAVLGIALEALIDRRDAFGSFVRTLTSLI